MNGKKAKLFRRVAENMTVGMDKVQYTDKALNPRKPARRTRFLYECNRLVYRNFKKQYKEAASR
jgi:hypothetical protein